MTYQNIKGASIAHAQDGARLFAPAAERNAEAIAALFQKVVPSSGQALEIASGTGQHITKLAQQHPDITWTPSEVDPARLASITALTQDVGLSNIEPALTLNALKPGWSQTMPPKDLIFLANLLHLVSWPETKTLIAEIAKSLAPNGQALIYGPFMRQGQLTSDGDKSFHASLIKQDPNIGYKDLDEVIAAAGECVLTHVTTHQMPANNVALHFRKTPQASSF